MKRFVEMKSNEINNSILIKGIYTCVSSHVSATIERKVFVTWLMFNFKLKGTDTEYDKREKEVLRHWQTHYKERKFYFKPELHTLKARNSRERYSECLYLYLGVYNARLVMTPFSLAFLHSDSNQLYRDSA